MSFDLSIRDQLRLALSFLKFKARQKRLRTNIKVIVDTTYGKIKGVKWHSLYGPSYHSFEGIPYAQPPLGELRFKAPLEPEPWTDVKRCTRQRSKPFQNNAIMRQMQGSEDCLYLNVYTRELHPRKQMPVLVWIYGGGFQMGEATRDIYSPDYFMLEHVVLVSISYRLGPLGFLSLADPELDVPGNAGLKDQVLALRWIKNNCQFFGGDPNNITVFGQSAGGASTHYMMLTEQTRGLFHKAICMSGTAATPWACPAQRNWPYRLAKATGYKGEDNDRLVLKHLRHCKPRAIFKVSEDLLTPEERNERLLFSFGPVIEPYLTDHCVIPQPPLQMMRNCWSNALPLLIGGNSGEGLLMFTEARKYPYLLNRIKWEHMPPADAHLNEAQCEHYGQMLQQVYFGDEVASWKTILHYAELLSYKYFWHGIYRTVLSRLHYASGATYLYRFDLDSKHFNFMRNLACGHKVRGTCHGDDLCYLFYHAGSKKLKQRTVEYKTLRRFVAIVARFAECGNPNIQQADVDVSSICSSGEIIPPGCNELTVTRVLPQPWQPVTLEDETLKCLNISDELEVIELPESEKLKLWNNMYANETWLY